MRPLRGPLLCAAVAFFTGCSEPNVDSTVSTAALADPTSRAAQEPITALVAPDDLDPGQVRLGGRLFHDPRLSGDGSLSCASCHQVGSGGEDGLPRSPGVGGHLGGINTPTVLNAGMNFVQFWNGRAATLEDQAGGPLTAPVEMNSSWEKALGVIRNDPDYARDFAASYADGVSEANFRSAIATFERSLVTTGGRFDSWLLGDEDAITAEEREGYELFKSVGCIACHQGRNVGGNMYQKFGVIGNYMEDRGTLTDADLGRFAVTGNEDDRFVFKVPSLRNISRTAPYLHDGSAKTLEDAVQTMSRYQLGRPLTDHEVELLVGFLKTLDGDIPDVTNHQAWVASRTKRGL